MPTIPEPEPDTARLCAVASCRDDYSGRGGDGVAIGGFLAFFAADLIL